MAVLLVANALMDIRPSSGIDIGRNGIPGLWHSKQLSSSDFRILTLSTGRKDDICLWACEVLKTAEGVLVLSHSCMMGSLYYGVIDELISLLM